MEVMEGLRMDKDKPKEMNKNIAYRPEVVAEMHTALAFDIRRQRAFKVLRIYMEEFSNSLVPVWIKACELAEWENSQSEGKDRWLKNKYYIQKLAHMAGIEKVLADRLARDLTKSKFFQDPRIPKVFSRAKGNDHISSIIENV